MAFVERAERGTVSDPNRSADFQGNSGGRKRFAVRATSPFRSSRTVFDQPPTVLLATEATGH